jgi:hypothetical protein
MDEAELESLEESVPDLAVRALTAASRRTLAAGRPVVLVVNNQLVRITPEGTTVLEPSTSRVAAPSRTKRATS